MRNSKRPRDINIVIDIGIFALVAIVAYWICWFGFPEVVQARTPADPDFAIYSAYELAFPLPDAVTVLAALIGVIGLWQMKDWGMLFMLLTAGGTFFLGLEDLLFDLENKLFTPFNGAAGIELAIVLLIMSLGPITTVLLWRRRKDLIV